MKEQVEALDKLRSVVGKVPKPIIHALEGRRAEVRIVHARPIEYRVAQEEDKNGKITELWAPVDPVLHVRSTLREWQERPSEAAIIRFGSHGGLTTVEVLTEDGWYKGEARCSEEDAFDRRVGRTLALERALERLEVVEEAMRAKRQVHPEVGWDRDEPRPEIPEDATTESPGPLWVHIEGESFDSFPGDMFLLAQADLVISGSGRILKERDGFAGRLATQLELDRSVKLTGVTKSRRGEILDQIPRDPREGFDLEESWWTRWRRWWNEPLFSRRGK